MINSLSRLKDSLCRIVLLGALALPTTPTLMTASAVGSLGVLSSTGMAEAQSGKRLCGTKYTTPFGGAVLMVEVYKEDFVTCTAVIAALGAYGAVTRAGWLFNGAVAANSIRNNGTYFLATCEKVNQDVTGRTWSICNDMQDYRLYAFSKINNRTNLRAVLGGLP